MSLHGVPYHMGCLRKQHDEYKPLTQSYTDSLAELGNLDRSHLSEWVRHSREMPLMFEKSSWITVFIWCALLHVLLHWRWIEVGSSRNNHDAIQLSSEKTISSNTGRRYLSKRAHRNTSRPWHNHLRRVQQFLFLSSFVLIDMCFSFIIASAKHGSSLT